jgi:aryl-alcohol dehydrogenase-like predicted oxidoreductase
LVPVHERARVVATLRQLQADGLATRLGLAGGHGEGWDGFVESGAFDVAMLFRRLDPCILAGVTEDLPRLRAAGLVTYGASPLHMGLLGARYDEFVRERPGWVWGPQIDRAIRLKALAEKNGLPLATLAHRFMFSVAELDRVVIGAGNRRELDGALADFEAGPLPADVSDAVCASG